MNNDPELETDIPNTIKWKPYLNATGMCVTDKNGIILLTEVFDNDVQKTGTEIAPK